ncbi:sugar transporter domain-containing protein [Phthorimaea operculella]|nr:sugar transporter domain-containing protein [Phthorimaea operculella]
MDQCLTEPLNKKYLKEKMKDKNEQHRWKPLLRQIVVCSGVCNTCFLTGLCFGSPTVIIPQLRRDANSTQIISEEMASWISSIHGLAAIPWFILPILSGKIGRKYPFLIVGIMSLFSYIGLFLSKTPIEILCSEILMAPLFACQVTIAMSVIVEYTSTKYRGMFLALPSASGNWGMWIANTLGTFFHWKTIAVTGVVCSVYNLLTILYWCESPAWLASKNRYEECIKAQKWIKGDDTESKSEVEALIESCKEHQKLDIKKKAKLNIWFRAYRTMLEKPFYAPLILSLAMMSLIHTSGKLVCSVYAIDIIKKITSTESTAYTETKDKTMEEIEAHFLGKRLKEKIV